jgi:hypothetical protein
MNPQLQSIRQRIEHEDNLISQRLSWLVASQSFLITAFAITLNAPEKFHSERYAAVHHRLLQLLPVVSIASIVVLMLTLLGALFALRRLRDSAKALMTQNELPVFSSTPIRWLGMSATLGIPVLFLLFWAALMMVL